MKKLLDAKSVEKNIIKLIFDDKTEKVLDISFLFGGAFGDELKDFSYQKQLKVYKNWIVIWPNGQDISPEDIYS